MPDAQTTRPSPDAIRKAYRNIFQPNTTLSKIHDAAINNRLFSSDSLGVPGRSLAWKLFLLQKEPLEDHAPSPPLVALHKARKDYVDLVAEKFRAPDGTYEEGFSLPGSNAAPVRSAAPDINLNTHNPLSLSEENPWKVHFANVDLRKTIRQDVERTFPDILYFRDEHVQQDLISILFVHALSHPGTGYRQGMHEILASSYFAVDHDSLDETTGSFAGDAELLAFCSRTWVAADAWALFEAVMQNLSPWYEWRDTIPIMDKKPPELPVIQVCKRMQYEILRTVDPLLWRSLEDTGIEPQLYGIRWLRLLFTREFPMTDVMFLWDGLLACDPTFDLAVWVCVAMLIRIRNELIPSDYTNQLSSLLRYPSPPTLPDSAPPVNPYMLLLKQAITLRTSPTTATGASIMIENKNLLNIPLEVPDPPPMARRQERRRPPFATEGRASNGPQLGHSRHLSSQAASLPEFFARNLMERGENLGLNNIMSAVSELRRNLPEIASPFTRSPPLDESYTAFPLRDEHRGNDRAPSWESHSRFELERDITNMRTMNRTLGEAASWILDALRNNDTTDPTTTLRREKALDSLSYLRDALRHGSLLSLDEGKLFDEEAMKSRRMRAAPSPSDSPTNHQDPQALNPRHFAKPRTTQHPLSPSFSGPSITPPANHHPMVPRGKHKPQYVTSNHVPSNTYKPPPQAGIKTISVSTIPDSSPPLRRRSEEVPKKSADNGLDPLGVLH